MKKVLLASLFLTGCATYYSASKDYVFQEIYYLTTRESTESEDPGKRYRGDRGALGYGVAMIAMDPEKRITSFAEGQPNYSLHQVKLLHNRPIQQLREMSEQEFMNSMESAQGEMARAPEALVYIHGYKQSFEKALLDSAMLRYELAFPGPVIAFAWPSRNTISGYMADAVNVEWSEPQLRRLVALLSGNVPGTRVHIIAHSMGNRALVKFLSSIQNNHLELTDYTLGEIILLAPDLDRAVFVEDTAARLAPVPARKTLYVSARDFPLMTSAAVYQYPRLGDSRLGAPILDGFETVDVSDATSITSGHDYYEKNRETLEDLHHLILGHMGASERSTLREISSETGTYWRLQPIGESSSAGNED